MESRGDGKSSREVGPERSRTSEWNRLSGSTLPVTNVSEFSKLLFLDRFWVKGFLRHV